MTAPEVLLLPATTTTTTITATTTTAATTTACICLRFQGDFASFHQKARDKRTNVSGSKTMVSLYMGVCGHMYMCVCV